MSDEVVTIEVRQQVEQVAIVVTPTAPNLVAVTVTPAGTGTGGEPQFNAWKEVTFLSGERETGIDSGICPSFAVTDDYLYVCVKSGDAGSAVWKKVLLFHT
jgi:hypothetical protein